MLVRGLGSRGGLLRVEVTIWLRFGIISSLSSLQISESDLCLFVANASSAPTPNLTPSLIPSKPTLIGSATSPGRLVFSPNPTSPLLRKTRPFASGPPRHPTPISGTVRLSSSTRSHGALVGVQVGISWLSVVEIIRLVCGRRI